MKNDMRKLQRRHLIYYLRVFNRKDGELLGHMVDITSEGIMLISEKPIEVGQDYELLMELPKDIFGKAELRFYSTSLWSRVDVNPSFYDTGFQLKETTPEDVDIIEELISDFGFSY